MSSWYRSGAFSSKATAILHRFVIPGACRLGVLCLVCTLGALASAQEVPPGIVATSSVDQRLEYSTNPDLEDDGEPDFFGRTILRFGLNSETKVQRLALDFGLDVEEGRNDKSTFDTANPFVQLFYDRNTRNATLSAFTIYREADVESDIDEDDFDFDSDIITQQGGTRNTRSFGLSGEVGRNAPISGSWSWDYDEITFSDTNDPDLTDQSRYALAGQVNVPLTPRVTANLRASYSDFDAQGDGTNRETTQVGAGVELTVSPVLTANFGLGYDRIERSGDETGTDDGLAAQAGLVHALPNGEWRFGFETDVETNEDGRRSNLSVGRTVQLPRSFLDVSFGLSGADIVGTDPLLNLDYGYSLPTAQVSLGVSQGVSTDSDNNERINTRVRAGYNKEINARSQLGLSFSLFDVNQLSDGEDDSRRIDMSLSYNYALTRDWGIVSGISYRTVAEDGSEDRDGSTIFIGLRRTFSWIP